LPVKFDVKVLYNFANNRSNDNDNDYNINEIDDDVEIIQLNSVLYYLCAESIATNHLRKRHGVDTINYITDK
jgi:hypothetical protein